MPEKFLKPYDPSATEQRIYAEWEKSGLFNPDECVKQCVTKVDAPTYSIVLPPPNVTGVLHVGHAYEDSLQDTIVRYHRMCGEKTLWIPGTDSAALPTQSRVEKDIQKNEGKNRYDLGRDELVRRVVEFAKNSEGTMLGQIRRMGASLDWSRYAYTLDEKRNKAVMTAFKKMYKAGLIYRGHRIVNWDPKGQTTISDDEIVYEERNAKLYTFRYSKDFPISIATTRPETKAGDVAVAVHPDDSRYKEFVGKEYDAVFCDVPIHIKIVADKEVDPAFGTGAVGITPAHSHIDWDIADRHQLSHEIIIIDEHARMTVPGRLQAKKTTEARDIVVEWLKNEGLLEKEEDIKQNIAVAERTGGIIEPLPKLQWWIEVNRPFIIEHSEIPGIKSGSSVTLKALMRAAVEHGGVQMPQEGFKKSYFHWIDNLRDWCISRQIWFGHRIPVWYGGEQIHIGTEAPAGDGWVQDPDVLDTWFSSALWTFSTLGWPEQTKDLESFHPTAFMSPAYEILPLWVSRMILMSGFILGQVPFRKVMLHGLVRDKQGRKFSKSLNNNIDPLDMIDKYGADALRMGLLVGTTIGNDISFDENKIKGYKHFANKLWNVARFVLMNTEGIRLSPKPTLTSSDQKMIDNINQLIREVTQDMDDYKMYLAAEKLYHYIWHEFADKIIEESKEKLKSTDATIKLSAQWTILEILATSLQLLHPFMPFITEEIYQSMPTKDTEFLMVAKWPN
jgi:valyl-tRNA synthetase